MWPDMPLVIVGLPMALALGLLFGMGPCLLSCMPYLGPVLLGAGGGVRQSWRVLLPISLGRITAYAALAGVCGWFGQLVADQASRPAVQLSVGSATLLMGAALWLRIGKAACATPAAAPAPMQPQPVHWVGARAPASLRAAPPRTLLPGGLFLMGVGMALTPCAPLSVVLFSAAVAGTVWGGVLLGLSFGLGAVTVPALVYGIGVAYASAQLRQQLGAWLPRIETASAALFVLVGLRQLWAWWV